MKRIPIVVPPLAEQQAIVRYLDHIDRRIRRYIRAKQRLLALLHEQKQAIIHQAVTRGLDASAPLKPSGVAWLGEVPAHWEVVRSKRLFSARKELARPDDVQLSATQAYGVIPQAEYEEKIGRRVVQIFMHLDKRRHVEQDDFVISMRSFQGGLERAWTSGCIRSSYVVLKPNNGVDVGFFAYLFKSHGYIQALQATANFIRDGQDLNFDNFSQVDLPLMPIREQRAIAEYLVQATSNIDKAMERIRRVFDKRKGYQLIIEKGTTLANPSKK
jgi:type I restriction enzyme S subunit